MKYSFDYPAIYTLPLEGDTQTTIDTAINKVRFKQRKYATFAILVWYGNRPNSGMRKGTGMQYIPFPFLIPLLGVLSLFKTHPVHQ